MRAGTPLVRDRNCTNDRHSPQRLVCSKGPYDVTEYFSRRPARNRPASLRSRNRRSDMICALFGERARSPVDTRPYPFQDGQTTVACHDPHGACRAGDMHWGDGGGDNAGQPAGRGPMITEFNRAAMKTPAGEKRLEVVPGAARLLDEARPW